MHFRNKLKEIFSNNSVLKSLKLFASKFKNVWSEYKIWKWIQILYFVILASYVSSKVGQDYSVFCLLEYFILSEVFERISNNKLKYITHFICLLLIGFQMHLLIFGKSYLSLIMITNLDSIEDISGNASLYVICSILLLIISGFPMGKGKKSIDRKRNCLPVLLSIELCLTMIIGNLYSPIYAYADLIEQSVNQKKLAKSLKESDVSESEFLRTCITDYYAKPSDLVEKPNVVVIFAEGISQNIIDDERNIMPNIKKYESESINFANYFNHTFATYRGLIGQLYSGYQLNNYDSNKLISVQSIFNKNGYDTSFINVEPNNSTFCAYIDKLGFDNVKGEISEAINGMAKSISDKDAFNKLYNEMVEMSGNNYPFFISMYTVGTHATFDSVDEKFEDGRSSELNKFYNLDYQFGQFMEKFENSELSDNTVIIFTTDHCTFVDDEYDMEFPNYERPFSELDCVPFFIYYKGNTPTIIDAAGRNSLDLAPTICDFLDISSENYFLGVSLFSDVENNTNYDTVFQENQNYKSTRGGRISELTDAEKKAVVEGITRYFSISSDR